MSLYLNHFCRGDPIVGTVNELKIVYSYGTKETRRTASCREHRCTINLAMNRYALDEGYVL
jgi:hypothetical protein